MIDLETNKTLLVSLFDYHNGNLYWKQKPCKNLPAGCVAGNGTTDAHGYLRVGYKSKRYKLHRLIWIYHNDFIPENLTIDHIDRNKSNNKIENLRLATKSQQQWNKNVNCNNKIGLTGVRWCKNINKWHTYITKNKKQMDYFFDSKDEAITFRKHLQESVHENFKHEIN